MLLDAGKKGFAIFVRLGAADARNLQQFAFGNRLAAAHVLQRRIGKDHISGRLFPRRDFGPQGAKRFEGEQAAAIVAMLEGNCMERKEPELFL